MEETRTVKTKTENTKTEKAIEVEFRITTAPAV